VPRRIFEDGDGVLAREAFAEPDGTVSSVLRQPSRDAVMEAARARPAPRALEWGRCVATIPLIDRYRLGRRYPDLDAPDAETRARAWARFLASAESAPYRLEATP
jgi:hypothetical protein